MSPTMNDSTPSVSRGAFLRSAAVFTGTAAGLGALSTAQAAPRGASPQRDPDDPHDKPASWRDTIMDSSVLFTPIGYLASFTMLYGEGPITKLSAKSVQKQDGIANFLPYGHSKQVEEFEPYVAESVALDEERVEVTFTSSFGLAIAADVQLVRTADPNTRALLLWVRGFEPGVTVVPKKTKITTGHFPGTVHQAVNEKDAAEGLKNAVALSFAEDGSFPITVSKVLKADDGTISGRVKGTFDGLDFDDTWFGVPVPGDEGVSYVFAARPQ